MQTLRDLAAEHRQASTLLFAARDPQTNHALVLPEFLQRDPYREPLGWCHD